MHFEVPKLPHSLREFAAHYVMIVVSILTALGLEALIEHLHHEHAAETAQHAIEAELRTNLSELRINDAANVIRLTPLNDLAEHLIKNLDDHVPIATIKADMAQRVKAGIDFGLFTPTLRHEAWDVAVANQSASYMDPETLRRLSVAYAAQRELNMGALTIMFNAPEYLNALTDARVGAADPHEFLRSIRQAVQTMRSAHNKFQDLDQELVRALPGEPAGSGAKAPTHAVSSASS